jgi:hypothetical protein
MGAHLYILQAKGTGNVKVGRSDQPEQRLLQLQTGSAHALRLIVVAPNRGLHERRVHLELKRYRLKGEWFSEACLGSMPVDIWEQTLPWYRENPDWWKTT